MTEIDWTKAETTRGGFPPDDARNMTLRDEFAKAALQGWIAGPCNVLDDYEPETDGIPWLEHTRVVARIAYDYADAMLAERAKRT
jgi:hypothetical protein